MWDVWTCQNSGFVWTVAGSRHGLKAAVPVFYLKFQSCCHIMPFFLFFVRLRAIPNLQILMRTGSSLSSHQSGDAVISVGHWVEPKLALPPLAPAVPHYQLLKSSLQGQTSAFLPPRRSTLPHFHTHVRREGEVADMRAHINAAHFHSNSTYFHIFDLSSRCSGCHWAHLPSEHSPTKDDRMPVSRRWNRNVVLFHLVGSKHRPTQHQV